MAADSGEPANRWLEARREVDGAAYDSTYTQRAAAGENVHGEADFVESYQPWAVLDAGCGTGRVGIELARRGITVVGADIDARMLAAARQKAPEIPWHLADLRTLDLPHRFGAIVLAGNVMIFLAPGTEGAVLQNMARHLAPDGVLIAGFQLEAAHLTLADYDRLAAAAGLVLAERYATWDRAPWTPRESYAVSVHRRPAR
ncbi:MAG TPA: class I SAM-dependent methyltransferase [Chloroflexia bacterium]|nr:class I SAM-dependent methyltransferase [Chloroflexia bacterium]